jgi:putative tricarboxylic transport membrane protein
MRAKISLEICFLLLFALYLFFSLEIPFGVMTQPGPGFLPVLLGVLGVFSSAIVLNQSLYQRAKSQVVGGASAENPKGNIGKIVLYTSGLIAFAAAMQYLGTLIGVFLLVSCLSKIPGSKTWKGPVMLGLLTSASIYFLFFIWFKVSLPQGFLNLQLG